MGMETKKNYTIDDIARELGVSKTTVSRAISGKGRIGQATRERVLDFIEKHNYSPNVMAKGLAQRKTYNIALVLPLDYAATEFPFFKDCMNGICEVASKYDYDVIISMLDGKNLKQLQRLVSNGKADGIIISRAVVSSAAQKYLKENDMPFVVIGPMSNLEIPSVDNRNREGAKELTSIMLMKGSRRLALLGGNHEYSVTGSRYEGFAEAHKEMGVDIEEDLLFFDVENQIKATQATKAALEKGAEGIICMDDVICNMALSSLREKKIRIPEQIKIASFYDSRNLEYNIPSVTSIRFDTVRLGKHACEKLLKILGENVEEDALPLNYQVILRESTQF